MVDPELRVISVLVAVRAALHEFRSRKGTPELSHQRGAEDPSPVHQAHLVARWNHEFESGKQRSDCGLVVRGAAITNGKVIFGGQFPVALCRHLIIREAVRVCYEEIIGGGYTEGSEILLRPEPDCGGRSLRKSARRNPVTRERLTGLRISQRQIRHTREVAVAPGLDWH